MSTFNPPPTAFDGLGLIRRSPRAGVRGLIGWSADFAGASGSIALEGFRLIWREPRAALAWLVLWLAAILLSVGAALAGGPKALDPARAAASSLPQIAHRFGPFAAVTITVFMFVWAVTTVAVYRAVLRPQDRRWFFLRLGRDELRLVGITAAAFVLVVGLGGVPAYLLFVLASPLMQALPALTRQFAAVGAIATVALEIWLGVRLSLIAVETFAERRFHLSAYWPLAKGRFWFLLLCYVWCFLIAFGLSLLFFFLGSLIELMANPDLGSGGLLRSGSLLGLAALSAVLAAAFCLMSLILFCACQAYAFGSIVRDGKDGVAIV